MKWQFIPTLALTCIVTSSVQAATQQEWQNYIDAAVTGAKAAATQAAGEMLPPGVSDVTGGLSNSPDIVKAGLGQWLHQKMQAAALADDWQREDRYQAYFSCLNGDCAKLRALTQRPAATIAGHWGSNIGFEYEIAQTGTGFEWVVASIAQRGEGTVTGSGVHARWFDKGGNVVGAADGTIHAGSDGTPDRIDWSNGVVFTK